MTVATIKPSQKQVSETTVLQMSNIQRVSMASNDQRPILTKQKQKIISSQDRPKVFNKTNNVRQNNGIGQIEQPPRNQTSCNNRTTAHKTTQENTQTSNGNFASVIIPAGERKSKAISQLARNSNLHFGSQNNYSELVPNTAQNSGPQINEGSTQVAPHHSHAPGNDITNKQIRYQSNGLTSDGELLSI